MRRLLLAIASLAVLIVAIYWLRHGGGNGRQRQYSAVNKVLGGAPAEGFERALTPRPFRFPEDHGPHRGFRNEWWYFTGNLKSGTGRSFGYQLTFFRSALTPHAPQRPSRWGTGEVYMAHFALTDAEGRSFRFAERFSRAALDLAGAGGTPLTVRLEDWTATETSEKPWSMRLQAAEPEIAIDLQVTALKPPVLNGEGGLSRKSGTPGNASYYYSLPRMATAGVIRSGRERFRVTGLSWLDREWSTSALESDQVGWDWFALQLDDGRDLMIYRIRRRDGSTDPFSAGTLIGTGAKGKLLRREDVLLQPSGSWTSPGTGARYPAQWRLQVPSQGIDLLVVPKLPDQELAASFRYWEGAVAVRKIDGAAAGSGYLEMTGY